ncbi:biotin--[acetyl-CoA-carboxylase] ligase, partial [Hydrogenovibrio sp. 3SP14C1]|uniref:biotin--[acetyl-CoA-carboxylase] ligase n=1 Tax=Hydrogenovibrio sp. 3SP14C1 TaxID=3038774 RepID=UPI002417E9F5
HVRVGHPQAYIPKSPYVFNHYGLFFCAPYGNTPYYSFVFWDLLMAVQLTPYQVIEFDEIDSTSGFLKSQLQLGELKGYSFCIARKQTQGYGQRGRQWIHSDQSLAFSLSVPFDLDIHRFSYLSSSVALLLRNCLARHSSLEYKVKWPNDIFVDEGKVAGSLLEMVRNKKTKEAYLVLGIGINLSNVSAEKDTFHSSWISDLNRDAFLTDFGKAIYTLFIQAKDSLAFKPEEWSKYDFFSPNQPVIVYHSDHYEVGLYKGLTNSAEVQVEIDGRVDCYQSGAISIRPITSEQT